MTYDLRAGLAGLGSEERDTAPELPVEALIARAHRLQTTHAVRYSAIGVGAAAVLAIGAINADGLLRDDDPAPAPPATTEPRPTPDRTTPAPTPSPTPTPTPTEVAWAPNWALCGTPVDDLLDRDRDTAGGDETESPWFVVADWPLETLLPDDAPFALGLRVFSYSDTPSGTVDGQLTDVVAISWDETGAGAVSAIAAVPTDEVLLRGPDGADIGGLPFDPVQMSLVSCAASPLDGGDGSLDTHPTGRDMSSVFALADISPEGGETFMSMGLVGYLGALPGPGEDPQPQAPDPNAGWQYRTLTVGTPLRLGPTETTHLECGAPTSTEPLRYDAAPEVTLTGTAFRDGTELIAQMTLTNTGDSPLPYLNLQYPYMHVSSNGVVVGSAYAHLIAFDLPVPLQPGESVQLEMSLGQSPCALSSEPWSAGTYELQVGAYLLVTRDVAESGIAGYEVRTTFTLG